MPTLPEKVVFTRFPAALYSCTSTGASGLVVAASVTSPVIEPPDGSAKLAVAVAFAITVMELVVVTLHGVHGTLPYATSV